MTAVAKFQESVAHALRNGEKHPLADNIRETVAAAHGTLTPIHPGEDTGPLSVWFSLSGDKEKELTAALSRMPGVEAAFVKSQDYAPTRGEGMNSTVKHAKKNP